MHPLIPTFSRRALIAGLCALAVLSLGAVAAQDAAADPLPSWNDGATKKSIIDFVARVTKEGGPDFVPEAQRIAVFDNDGTLWAEQPVYFQFAFALDRVAALAPQHPEWEQEQPFKAILSGDLEALAKTSEKEILEIMAATHTGITTDAFGRIVDGWLEGAEHPRFKRRYTELVYQPMLELLSFLRDNGFKTFIVSGGGVEFIRRFAESVYGIPPEQVLGSSGVVEFEFGVDGKPRLVKKDEVEFVNDGPGKPVGINRFIGREPILAFGNSDGDLAMLQYTAAGPGPRLAALIHHTDADREWAYDRKSHVGKLDKALDEATARGWTVVDMKQDWNTVFPPEKKGRTQ